MSRNQKVSKHAHNDLKMHGSGHGEHGKNDDTDKVDFKSHFGDRHNTTYSCMVISISCGEQVKIEKTGCKIICGAPTTLAVKG